MLKKLLFLWKEPAIKISGCNITKNEIKEKFHELRKAIEHGQKKFVLEEWERTKQLLDTINFAFKKIKDYKKIFIEKR